jgi:O-acetylhomoserine (thiol)-lyase
LSYLGLPAPLFTTDMEEVPRDAFRRFFDNLAPAFGHMISLGQTNTIVSCPALTTHSELGPEQLAEAGISPTTIRYAVGHEDPHDLIDHLRATAELAIDPDVPGFSKQFPSAAATEQMIRDAYLSAHGRYIDAQRRTHG